MSAPPAAVDEISAARLANDDIREQATQHTLAANPLVGIRDEDIIDSARALVGHIMRNPTLAAQHYFAFINELTRIASGHSKLAPDSKDRRFADPAWKESATYRALAQCYLAWSGTLNRFIDATKIERRDAERARFVTSLLVDAMAPTNSLAGNPTALKKLIDWGACSGGIVTSACLANLAAHGEAKVHSATIAVCLLDMAAAQNTTAAMFVTPGSIAAAKAASQFAGVVEGQELARMFAWMRPNDLIWNYWVNNYLLGNPPPAFDILYWNNDTTRLPAQLHADFLDLLDANPFVNAGRLKVRGTPLVMGRVNMDSYVVAGATDHITPWQGCYQTAKLYGERSTFVLANSGHIQSLLNPPDNPKASFFTGAARETAPEAWLGGAAKHVGSWWPHWLAWIKERSGEMTRASAVLGSENKPPIDAAPGRYVMEP